MTNIAKLLSVSSGALCPEVSGDNTHDIFKMPFASHLHSLLQMANGFYAFEGALYVRPTRSQQNFVGVYEWNAKDLWKQYYPCPPVDLICFAEDVFGCQFALDKNGNVYKFDSETGDGVHHSDNIDEWASLLIDDYNYETGYSLAHTWQINYGMLKPEVRLVPRIPFVLGGEYRIENLVATNAIDGMVSRGNLACKIHDLPDGTAIVI